MINAWLQSIGLLILRVSFGTMMLAGHGLDKLLHFGQKSGTFPDPLGISSIFSLGLATFAEFFCSILVILGLGTRFAAIPLVVTMLVAAVNHHAADEWKVKEPAVAYLVAFVVILITGSGPFGLDRFFRFRGQRKV
ncbi:putative oxidoreductase [Planctomicrobium piriforme]|uniref:Putative oxidoreductase n=2 Tax=Planctomicrobium piriforme TaxID=1576369 RepID=A0A1I3LCD4_9PLAN|nr:putative oxidoreductase [Planctomicrobium piriforme]